MNLLFVSHCRDKARTRSHRILCQYGEQIGQGVWSAELSLEGIAEVRAKLNQSASRLSSVACHVIKKSGFRQLLWIVGSRKHYSPDGLYAFSIHRKQTRWAGKPVTEAWKLMEPLAQIAGLLHDLGKANQFFQAKLSKKGRISDPFRHEYLSLALFFLVVKGCSNTDTVTDGQWITALNSAEDIKERVDNIQRRFEKAAKTISETKSGKPPFDIKTLGTLPPLALCLAQLILSHHKNALGEEQEGEYQMEASKFTREFTDLKKDSKVFMWHDKAPWIQKTWGTQLAQLTNKLHQSQPKRVDDSLISYTQYILRPALVLADQLVSARAKNQTLPEALKGQPIANTNRDKGPAQSLEQHLSRVSLKAGRMVRLFREVISGQRLEYLDKTPAALRSPVDPKSPFYWQQTAEEGFKKQKIDPDQPFFGVVMAETGSGKTRGNARILFGAQGHTNLRASFALGMRSLTLQTGDELIQEAGLPPKDTRVMIGSQLANFLHEESQLPPAQGDAEGTTKDPEIDEFGRETETEFSQIEALLGGDMEALDFNPDSPWPQDWSFPDKPKLAALLRTPILISTVDQLIQAVQSDRSSASILLLRFMSADLVLDEIDSYDSKALVALGKVAFLQGMFGRKLLISSATCSPGVCLAMFTAYQKGYALHSGLDARPKPLAVGWFSHLTGQHKLVPSLEKTRDFTKQHAAFSAQLIRHFQKAPKRRLMGLIPRGDIETKEQLFEAVWQASLALHQAHPQALDGTALPYSIGSVRWNRVDWCQGFSNYVIKKAQETPDLEVSVLTYHSKFFPLALNKIETELDGLVKRRPQCLDAAPKKLAALFSKAQNNHKKSLLVLVCTSPISEIGRDHDYDWAVIEPCSLASMVQMAGRVWRHRPEKTTLVPNIMMMPLNTREIDAKTDGPVYYWPGPEHDKNEPKIRSLADDCRSVTEAFELEEAPLKITPIPSLDSPELLGEQLQQGHPNLRSLEHYSASLLLAEGGRHSLPPFLNPRFKEPNTLIQWLELHSKENPFREQKPKFPVWYQTDADEPGWRAYQAYGKTQHMNSLITLKETGASPGDPSYFTDEELSPSHLKKRWSDRLTQGNVNQDELLFRLEIPAREYKNKAGFTYQPSLGLSTK